MIKKLFFFVFLILFNTLVTAGGVTIGGTRLIYDGGKREASLNIINTDNAPYLIQSWVENLDETAQKVPFIITPPLFRLDGNQKNVLRVVRVGDSPAEDKESLYWLSVKTIPSGKNKEGANTLQIAVRTRIKLIYRPSVLRGIPEDVTDKLIWTREGNRLIVTNPTPFIMNFQMIKVGKFNIENPTWVMPNSQSTFELPFNTSGVITWQIINDYGGIGSEHYQY